MLSGEPPRLVLFDCDGTLVDSQHAIAGAMAVAFAAFDLAAPEASAVRRVVGLSLEEAIALLLPSPGGHPIDGIAESYKQAFRSGMVNEAGNAPLYPGVRDGLAKLGGADMMLGVCTGKGIRGLTVVLEAHDLGRHFATLQTADRHPGKPHPAMVEAAMAEVGAVPAETVLVGDTTYDMELAGNAGVAAIGVSWGYHEPALLRESGAETVVESFTELERLLLLSRDSAVA